jgi:hypothetical protein
MRQRLTSAGSVLFVSGAPHEKFYPIEQRHPAANIHETSAVQRGHKWEN